MGRAKSDAEINRQIGERIRQMRLMRGMTQADLGLALRITSAQVGYYELGRNRVAAAMLVQIAAVFGCPPSLLFPQTRPRTRSVA